MFFGRRRKKKPNILHISLPISLCTHYKSLSAHISRQDEGKTKSGGGYLLLGVFQNEWLTRDWIKHLIIFHLMIPSLSTCHIIVH